MTATATIAERAREVASSCEAKKHGYRQTQDGVVISFVLHPQQVPDALATASLGTRYMLALVELNDDETPKEVMPGADRPDTSGNRRRENGGETQGHAGHMAALQTAPVTRTGGPSTKERRPFDTLPPTTQAVLWCKEPRFWKLLQRDYPVIWELFLGVGGPEQTAAGVVRQVCGVNSRGSITTNNPFWRRIVSDYLIFIHHPELG